jgi:5'-deoxynucleotidase YfbR-like HD superfamily hydrolase
VAIPETVGHHTCNVISLLFILYENKPPLHLIQRALLHDVTESLTGDVPAPAKWQYPELANALDIIEGQIREKFSIPHPDLDITESAMLTFVDLLDLSLKCIEEVETGNDAFKDIFSNGARACLVLLQGPLKDFKKAHEVFTMLFNVEKVEVEPHGPIH